MERVQGEPLPVGRAGHSACCLNYGEDHPQLLVYGGLGNDNNTLGDMWILDVDTGKWTEVSFSQLLFCTHNKNRLTVKPRFKAPLSKVEF